jgi:GH15 family glucan-1,4-alpha-glucosidase
MVKDAERLRLEGPVAQWRAMRDRLHRQICDLGFDRSCGAFVQAFDASGLDASALLIPLVGFLPPDDPRVRGTVDAIRAGLTCDGFVRRYDTGHTDDGLPAGEGVFLPCSFWLVDNLCMLGEHDEAVERFERLLGCCNDVGLLAEEIDPVTGAHLGNFPQAFTHVALIDSAINLTRGRGPAQERARM